VAALGGAGSGGGRSALFAGSLSLLEEILDDPNGLWTTRDLTTLISNKVKVSAGGVQDSLYLLMANNLLEAVPLQESLTLRLRTDTAKPFAEKDYDVNLPWHGVEDAT
jgi:hypothetical protein